MTGVQTCALPIFPQKDRDQLRRHVGDAALAGIAGARTSEADHLRALDRKAKGFEAIAIAASIIRHTEIDDIHLESCTTPSSVTVPVALMLAREAGISDVDRIASAIWAGTDLIVRLGVAINGPTVLYRGVWPTAIGAPLGAAAVAARIWGLDRATTENALSIALMMTAGRTGRFKGALSGRWVLFIGAIAEGLRAAHSARLGFGGDPSLLDGPWMQQAQGIETDVSKLTDGLGETSVFPLLGMKPFCTARQALGATQAMIELVDEGLDPATIDSVKVRVPNAYQAMISAPIDPSSRSTGRWASGARSATSRTPASASPTPPAPPPALPPPGPSPDPRCPSPGAASIDTPRGPVAAISAAAGALEPRLQPDRRPGRDRHGVSAPLGQLGGGAGVAALGG